MSDLPESGDHRRKLDVQFAGGLAWTAGVKWVTQLLTWVSLFATARLLSPSDFGVSEMAAMFYGLTNLLAEFGIGTAVLQMQELERKALAQLHTFSCVLCTVVFAVSLLAAPLIGRFFHIEHLTLLIATNNLGFLIMGFQAVPLGLLQRDMDYRRLSFAEAAMVVLQSVITVGAAWAGWGYWSLVAGAAVGKATAAGLVYFWKPVPFAIPRWQEIRKPIELGRQVAVGRLAWSAYTLSDGIVVGRVLGESVLGMYRMAMNLAAAPAEKISTLIMRAAGPLFAKVQNDPALVRRYFLLLAEVMALSVLPLMLGLALVAPEAITVVLGSKWAAATVPLQWLALFMTLRTLGTLMEQVLISQRATRFTMRMSLWNLAVMPIAFFIAARWQGPAGVAAAWLILTPVTILPVAVRLLRGIQLSYREMAAVLWPALASSAVMVLVVAGLRVWLASQPWPALARLAVLVAAGGVVYGGVLMGFFRERILRYVRFLRGLRNPQSDLATVAP